MIELAPRHKIGLSLPNPVMVAAGCWGMGSEYGGLVDVASLGAVVVGPLTATPRRGASPPRLVPVPGGLLLHTGLDNPGLPAAIRRYGRIWARSPVPVLLHLAATTSAEVTAACEQLGGVEGVAGIELGLWDRIGPTEAGAMVAAAVAAASQPLLVRLPLAQAHELAPIVVQAGAVALTVGAPPRGTAFHQGRFVTGRLYGPFVLPLALRALRQVVGLVDVPLIGCGGVYSAADAQAFLRAGATAVQVDAAIWQDPTAPARIGREVG